MIPTEPKGSSLRPPELLAANTGHAGPVIPFACEDVATTRATAFARIRARVEGTALASAILSV